MSLKTWLATKVVKHELNRLEKAGKMDWIMKNKVKVGAVLAGLAQALRAFPEVPHAVVEVLTAITVFIAGTGALPSDKAAKEFGTAAK